MGVNPLDEGIVFFRRPSAFELRAVFPLPIEFKL